jgi:branched-chain amino acid transport system substrate-binding protein
MGEPPPAKTPITFGGTLALSGKYGTLGKMTEKGFRLWGEGINASGGLLGRPVRIRITDDRSDMDEVSNAYSRMTREKSIDLLVSPYGSDLVLRAAEHAEKHRYPLLVIAASEKIWQTPRRYTFGIYSTSDRYFVGFLELCAAEGMKTVAIAGFPESFSSSAAEGARKWAEKFGLSVIRYRILPNKDDATYSAEAEALKSARPDAVVVSGYLEETVAFRSALGKTGFRPRAFAGSVGPVYPEFREKLGELAEGAFGATQWEPDTRISTPGSVEFIRLFRARYNEDPTYHAASAYASMLLLEGAIRKIGSLDREKIRSYLLAGSHKTLLGPFKLREDGTQIGHRSFIIQWQRGKKEVVWPDDLRTANPVFSK